MISNDELKVMKVSFMRHTVIWSKAFVEFNEAQVANGERTLQMHCRSCWFKVYKFHEAKISNHE